MATSCPQAAVKEKHSYVIIVAMVNSLHDMICPVQLHQFQMLSLFHPWAECEEWILRVH